MDTKSYQKGQALILLIVGIIIVGAGFLVGGFNYVTPKSGTPLSSDSIGSATGSAQIASSQDAVCSHFDGICHPLTEALCCDRMRALCKNETCTGYLPPASTIPATDPVPTINPNCGIDEMCKSICGNNEGFLCL